MIKVIEYLTRIYPWILLGVAVAAAVVSLTCTVAARVRYVRTVRRLIDERSCAVCKWCKDYPCGDKECLFVYGAPDFEAKEEYKRIAEGWRYKRGKRRKNH